MKSSSSMRNNFCYLAVALAGLFVVPSGLAQDCVPKPAGLVGWWRGEGDAADFLGNISGTPTGDTSFRSGKVGQAFVFDGTADGVFLGNPASMQLQNFSIEAWVKRSSPAQVSSSWDGGEIFGYGYGGFVLGLVDDGRAFLSRVGISAVISTNRVADTNWHHLAVTKAGSTVAIYVDGVAEPMSAYDPGFTFDTEAAIGIRSDDSAGSFLGAIDEVAFYNRSLASAEVQAIYTADASGKCLTPAAPIIVVQPTNRTVAATGQTMFAVVAMGDAPLTYEWRFFETNVLSETSSVLSLTNVQPGQAGDYRVVVSNPYGATTSSIASLIVGPPPSCLPPPAGLISWWPSAGDYTDSVTGNHGTAAGNVVFGPGRVGQGLVLDGDADGVQLGNPASLQLQDFTIEAWIKRANDSQVSLSSGGGLVFGHGYGGFGLGLDDAGHPFLTRVGISAVTATAAIADTSFHHVAVTKSGSVVVFYVDGVGYTAPSYSTTFSFTTGAAIGTRGDNLGGSFWGCIDEVSVYSHALQPAEVQSLYEAGGSGKCSLPVMPSIVSQPATANVLVGANAAFRVVAGGSPLLNYQWLFGSANIAGATNASLTVSNVQFSNAGSYSVVISNYVGSITSSVAALNVAFPPASARLLVTNSMAGATVVIPVALAANGNENSFAFSLNYSAQRLVYAGATLGSGSAGASLLINTSMTNLGRIGLAVVLPSPSTLSAGTQEVVRVTFNSLHLLGTQSANTTISFGDQPVVRELSDSQLNPLPANYFSSTFTLAPTILEGDVSPRTNGNQSISTTDWLQIGRFVARLDSITFSNEFRRADSAPRASFGDGLLKVTDWVQAGRYLAGDDSLAAVGGPSVEASPTAPLPSPNRRIRMGSADVISGGTTSVFVTLESQGNENALGFTLSYSATALTFLGLELGSAATGASFVLNTNEVGGGRLGVIMALGNGTVFPSGSRQIARVNFATTAATGTFPFTFSDQLAARCGSDAAAGELPVSFESGSITVISANARPTLAIGRSNSNVVLSWDAWAGDYALQSATALGDSGTQWNSVAAVPQTNNGQITLTVLTTNQAQFFRLRR